jgi:ribosomal protein L21
MYAIVEIAGQQFKVSKDLKVYVTVWLTKKVQKFLLTKFFY